MESPSLSMSSPLRQSAVHSQCCRRRLSFTSMGGGGARSTGSGSTGCCFPLFPFPSCFPFTDSAKDGLRFATGDFLPSANVHKLSGVLLTEF